jgi:serine/threonine protein kinase/hemoglobin-like flavoprotein/class 3 adenylate cyclase
MNLPSSLGKYRLLDRIGAGAMGEVYRAHDSVLDRPVALKIIMGGDEERRQRFRREAQSAARLTHPNIVVVHDFGEEAGRFFMAMELLEGTDLKGAISRNLLPDLRTRMAVMEQVCDAVTFAHATNIVHRDLKPANIFLLPSGQVKILDFGLARVGQSSMTGTGMVLGTPNYMAPEQIKGQRVDARADVFALGAVFYELLSGHKAFEGDSLHAVLYRVVQHEPEPLRKVVPNIPVQISDVIARALAKEPLQRHQSVGELRDALRAARKAAGTAELNLVSLAPLATESSLDGLTLITPASDVVEVPVTFTGELGSDITVTAAAGRTILEISLENDIRHANACGGNARCSTCRVSVLAGAQHLSPRNAEETNLARRLNFSDDVRLACQTRVGGPVRLRRLIRDEDDVSMIRSDSGSNVRAIGREVPLAVLHATTRETMQIFRKLLAHDVVHVLNRYYAQVGDVIFANGGHLARFDGTTMVALFGLDAEDARAKCTSAVRAALRMQKRMDVFNQYLAEHFGLSLTLDLGLHYGRMIAGHLGHPEHARMTAFGETANIAQAVAAENALHGTRILATEELLNVVEGQVQPGVVVYGEKHTLHEVVDFAKPDVHYLVQTTFEIVNARKDEAAAIFYGKLFELAPHMQPLFANTDIRVQGQMLMNMLAAAVRGLDRIEELRPQLADLGRRHATYGVEIPHYALVEACLLYTVETLTGTVFNLDVKLAWTEIYNFIAETMIEASV